MAFLVTDKNQPGKVELVTLGDECGGFWVVAVTGQECVYFNDIEDGFNISQYRVFGHIDNYYCDQIELEYCVRWFCQAFIKEMMDGTLTTQINRFPDKPLRL